MRLALAALLSLVSVGACSAERFALPSGDACARNTTHSCVDCVHEGCVSCGDICTSNALACKTARQVSVASECDDYTDPCVRDRATTCGDCIVPGHCRWCAATSSCSSRESGACDVVLIDDPAQCPSTSDAAASGDAGAVGE